MKYIIYYLFLILCVVVALAIAIPKQVKGDVNCDGRVSITDLVILHRYVVDGVKMQCPGNGDVNKDFRIDMKDVEALRNKLAE